MDKCAIFLFMTVLFISLTIVSAEEVSQDTVDIQTTDTIQQTSSISHQVQAVSDNNNQKENLKMSNKSSNSTQKQETNVIHKEKTNNLKADASQDLSAIESSTKTKLENAFSQAKIEIDNAQSTYEKEQIPSSVKEIANQIATEAERAERIYAESGDQSLIDTLNKIRNYAGYADLLIHPEKLTDPEWASRYRTRPLDKIGDKYNLFTIVAQKLNGTQESVYINLTSDEFQNLYNDVGEIHHPGEFDKYGNVQLVNKTNFIQITPDPTEFELIPFPFARIYLEDSYKRGYPYTMTFASCANASGGWYHVYGSTLTKQTYLNHTLNEIVEGNSGIAFWRMIKTNNPNMKYVLTDERYYPDKDGHPPYNMPAENGDDNGIYFVGYVIKSETGGIHIDGVIVEYRVPEDTHDVNFTVKKVWNDTNNQDGMRPTTITVELLADGEKYGDHIVLHQNNNWTYDYVNLPRYNQNRDEVVYTIHEVSIPTGYRVSYNNYTITNTHIPETKNIEVLKEWDDDYNRDGIRPKSVTVDLYANGALKDTVVINASNWRYTFNNLPVYSNGNKINYTIQERSVNGYTTTIRNVSNDFIITNSYTPRVRNVTVKKVWNDSNNQDGIRPNSITVQLLKDETPYLDAVTLNSNNNWTYTFNNIPVNQNGKAITYTAIETNIPSGYNATNNGLTITNTHIPEVTQLNVLKVWNDDHNRDGLRPGSVTVDLYVNNVLKDTVVINASNWRYTFNNLPVYSNGNKINYTVNERSISGYNSTVRKNGNEFTITNTRIPSVRNVTVRKVWNDSNNQDGIRPNSISVQLLKDETPYLDAVTLNSNNNWTYTFNNLPVNQNGKAVRYTAIENGIPAGYTTVNDGLTIINTHIPKKTQIEVFKEWKDDHNRDGIRPGSVTVNLLADDEVIDEISLNSDNQWRHNFEGLNVYKDGKKITYTVKENSIANYTTTITNDNGNFIIINSHTPLVKELNVIKVWDDHENEHNTRPDSVQVQLFANGEKYGESVTLTASTGWKYTFTNLPVNFDGKEILYVVKEVILPEEYYNTIELTANNEITITNIFDPEHAHVKVIKEWDDNHDSDKLRPSSIQVQLYANGVKQGEPVTLSQSNYWRYSFENLLKYVSDGEVEYTVEEVTKTEGYNSTIQTLAKNEYAIVNTHIPEKINITINKVWNDSDDHDGLRPETTTIDLLANGEIVDSVVLSDSNDWTYTFVDLDKNYDGSLINYTVNEVGMPDGYTVSYDGYTITNTHVPEVIELHVVKEWIANFNQDGLRPDSVEVQLNVGDEVIETVSLSEGNNWTYIFRELPRFADGSEIEYTVTETPVPGYTTTVVNNDNKVIIRNVHIPETINITINKVWNDNDNQDGIRPTNVIIDLLANGEIADSVSLSESNNWSYTFIDLNKYNNGTLINYTTNEVGIPEGYNVSYDGYTITNTHVPEVIELHVVKEWIANFNQDGLRPDSVEVQLNRNGEVIETVSLSEGNNWTYIFRELPRFVDGSEIEYTVTETPVPGYTTTVVNNDSKIIIRNVHIPETINITINKVWNDNDNQDALRPDYVTIELLANGEKVRTVNLSESNHWTNTFTDLDKYHNGTLINYTTNELETPEGYTVTYDGYTITNTHIPETIDVIVIVTWDDLDNIDEIRPDNVTIIIYKNGEPIENRTVNPEDDWRSVFEDLPKYENGTLINYTADEILPDGYTRTIEINEYKIIINNIHRPELINITVQKVWDDDNNRDNIRPQNITVVLLADGKENATVTLSAQDNWEYLFINLPKTKKGVEIVYTIKEIDNINNYTTTYEGFTITNKHEPETVNLTVNVIWDDLDDIDEIRPDNVTIIIYADGEPIENRTITPDDDWKTIFEDLPKYENGTEINYTADEILPDGYTKTIDINDNEVNITNIHRPETIDITVDIVWDDLDDQDGIRPDNVTIILYENGKPIQNITVTKDTWNTVFENLPKYKDGNEINYTIDEVLPNGYTKTIDVDGTHFTVTNIHRPETKDIPVTIKWDDLEDIDGIRPGNVTLILYADGKEVSRITVTPEDNWKTIFENLPKYANGKEIKYTVDEVLPNGYTKTINETEEGFIITNIHRPQLVWTWKLVEIIQEDEPNDNPDNITPTDKQPTGKIDKQQPRTNKQFTRYNNAKTYSNYARYNRYNRYNNYNRYSRYNRGYNNKVVPTISKRLYRLYIQLYNQYLEGKISLADFIVILEKEGLDPQILNFNEDGTITIDYDSLEKVPDKITVQYKNDNIPTTSDEIDTSNPDNNEAPVIDSGEVKVPTTTQSSSNSNNGQSSSSQSSPSQSSSSQSSDAE